ncbi:MAG: hypothetical protein Q8Q58_14900, partial [Candidatus Rokubacteria bacterium]|nr:hypothetical protein [Candidatus Rokubacteria bacterium]
LRREVQLGAEGNEDALAGLDDRRERDLGGFEHKWVVGSWNGTFESGERSGQRATVDFELGPDGTCKGIIQSPTGILVPLESCTFEVVEASVRLKYVTYFGRGRSLKKVELDLKRQGEELVGSRTRLKRR